ncbi:hypothetical protein GGI13_008183, partial [Coemansia sp. RSA 455]
MASSSDKAETHQQKYMAMDAEERGLFNTWRRAISEYTGLGLTPSQQESRATTAAFNKDLSDCKRCEKWRNDLMQT